MGRVACTCLERQHVLPCCSLTPHFQGYTGSSRGPVKGQCVFAGWVWEETAGTRTGNLRVPANWETI